MIHARAWHRLPSLYPEIESFGSVAGAFSYVVTHNHNTKQWSASFKRQSGGGTTKFIGTFDDGTAAYEACEKHYRASLS
jgi:hypothetical protein